MQLDSLPAISPDVIEATQAETAAAPPAAFSTLLARMVQSPLEAPTARPQFEPEEIVADDDLSNVAALPAAVTEGLPSASSAVDAKPTAPSSLLASIPPAEIANGGGSRQAPAAPERPELPVSGDPPREQTPPSAEGVRAESVTKAGASPTRLSLDRVHASETTAEVEPSVPPAPVARPREVSTAGSQRAARRSSETTQQLDEIPRGQPRSSGGSRDPLGQREFDTREGRDPAEGARLLRSIPAAPAPESALSSLSPPLAASPQLSPAWSPAHSTATATTLPEWVPPAPSASGSIAQINERVEWLAQRGGGSARVALDPPHLGEIEVQVRTMGEDVQVRLLSALPATQGALEMGRDWLIDQLAARDFQNINVEFGSRGDHTNEERAALDRESRDSGERAERDRSQAEHPSATPDESAREAPTGRHRIDLRI